MWGLRTKILKSIPAAVHFVSYEPALESLGKVDLSGIDWVIAGPETGPKARQMKKEWIADLMIQCDAAGVPFFDKKNTLGLNLQQFPEVSA